jgi:ABC-type multidrug transport system ATPase subunit
MMAASLLHPSSGSVLIGEYDPRVQPVHCKRMTGFVPHDPLPLSHIDADRFIAYRAALWDIDRSRARAHARLLLERLEGVHEAFAYPIVAALLPSPQLLVLDRPQPQTLETIVAASGGCTIFTVRGGR